MIVFGHPRSFSPLCSSFSSSSSSHVCLLLSPHCQAACPSNTHTYNTHTQAQPIGEYQSPHCLPVNALLPGQQEGMRPTLLEHFKLDVDSFFEKHEKVSLCKIAPNNMLRPAANPVVIRFSLCLLLHWVLSRKDYLQQIWKVFYVKVTMFFFRHCFFPCVAQVLIFCFPPPPF